MKKTLLMVVILLVFVVAFGKDACATSLQSGDYVCSIEDGECTLVKYQGSTRFLTIPDTLNGCPVTVIGQSCFEGSEVEYVKMPQFLKSIGEAAFYGCWKLQEIELPQGLEIIESRAFESTSLAEVTIPGSVKTIEASAFCSCEQLKKLTLEEGVENIGAYAFLYCGELDVVFPKTIETIGQSAFDFIELVVLPVGAEYTNAFIHYGHILEYEIENNECTLVKYSGSSYADVLQAPDQIHGCPVTVIGANCFKGNTTLSELYIPNTVKRIENYAVSYTDIALISIPNVEYIGDWALAGNANLEYLSLPNELTTLGMSSFAGSALMEITIPGTVKTIPDSAFMDCRFLEAVKMQNGVEIIGNGAFRGCENLYEVRVPESVTTICSNAFTGCDILDWIELPEGIVYENSDPDLNSFPSHTEIEFYQKKPVPTATTVPTSTPVPITPCPPTPSPSPSPTSTSSSTQTSAPTATPSPKPAGTTKQVQITADGGYLTLPGNAIDMTQYDFWHVPADDGSTLMIMISSENMMIVSDATLNNYGFTSIARKIIDDVAVRIAWRMTSTGYEEYIDFIINGRACVISASPTKAQWRLYTEIRDSLTFIPQSAPTPTPTPTPTATPTPTPKPSVSTKLVPIGDSGGYLAMPSNANEYLEGFWAVTADDGSKLSIMFAIDCTSLSDEELYATGYTTITHKTVDGIDVKIALRTTANGYDEYIEFTVDGTTYAIGALPKESQWQTYLQIRNTLTFDPKSNPDENTTKKVPVLDSGGYITMPSDATELGGGYWDMAAEDYSRLGIMISTIPASVSDAVLYQEGYSLITREMIDGVEVKIAWGSTAKGYQEWIEFVVNGKVYNIMANPTKAQWSQYSQIRATLTFKEQSEPTPTPATPTLGDADDNGVVDVYDALLVLQYNAGWNVFLNAANADITGDGEIGLSDALQILQCCAGRN